MIPMLCMGLHASTFKRRLQKHDSNKMAPSCMGWFFMSYRIRGPHIRRPVDRLFQAFRMATLASSPRSWLYSRLPRRSTHTYAHGHYVYCMCMCARVCVCVCVCVEGALHIHAHPHPHTPCRVPWQLGTHAVREREECCSRQLLARQGGTGYTTGS